MAGSDGLRRSVRELSRCVRASLASFAAIMFALLSISDATSADFESGCEAWRQGDFERAVAEWKPLAEQGHAKARFRLGCLYTFGQGVPENYEEAARLYRLAAEQGDNDAQNNLGAMYAEGLGVKADFVEAYVWLKIAASQGHVQAEKNLEFLCKKMTQEQTTSGDIKVQAWLAEHSV